MNAIPVIAVFDVGKTNKKVFLFDETYKIVYERTDKFPETKDEDGDVCEDLDLLTQWCVNTFRQLKMLDDFMIRAVNFSAYGASFVHLDENGEPFLPLYNYLKPYPATLKKKFFDTYGGEAAISKNTASPVLDSLNSGLQLYRLKYEKKICDHNGYSLHLPQYLAYRVTGEACSDITSIGCHTMLWDFSRMQYHDWVIKEGLDKRLAPVFPGDKAIEITDHIVAGMGLHDSSSALIPYLASFNEPFALLSTGTWCITLNPFNDTPLTAQELEQDCLCYLTYKSKPVKASRLFAGNEHELQVNRLAAHFNKPVNYYGNVPYDSDTVKKLRDNFKQDEERSFAPGHSVFKERDLNDFRNYEEAYHQLMLDIMARQVMSSQLVMQGVAVKRLFVDGGFSKNPVFMNLLAACFAGIEVFAASVAQSTAIGAALAMHDQWNNRRIPADLIGLRHYSFQSGRK